jgi:hypothetical protein
VRILTKTKKKKKERKEINLKSKFWNHYKHGSHVRATLSAFPEEAVCGLRWLLDDNLEMMNNSFYVSYCSKDLIKVKHSKC